MIEDDGLKYAITRVRSGVLRAGRLGVFRLCREWIEGDGLPVRCDDFGASDWDARIAQEVSAGNDPAGVFLPSVQERLREVHPGRLSYGRRCIVVSSRTAHYHLCEKVLFEPDRMLILPAQVPPKSAQCSNRVSEAFKLRWLAPQRLRRQYARIGRQVIDACVLPGHPGDGHRVRVLVQPIGREEQRQRSLRHISLVEAARPRQGRQRRDDDIELVTVCLDEPFGGWSIRRRASLERGGLIMPSLIWGAGPARLSACSQNDRSKSRRALD